MAKPPPADRGRQPIEEHRKQNSTEDGRDRALGRPEFPLLPIEREAFDRIYFVP